MNRYDTKWKKVYDQYDGRYDDLVTAHTNLLLKREEVTQNKVCQLKGCNGKLEYYDGALGYEALVCNKCGAHYTHNAIYPNTIKK